MGAADPKNPALVLIAAFCAKNAQNGNRAAQEYLLDWSELSEHKDEQGRTLGFATEVALTKVDRAQKGERKPLQCPSTCTGEVTFTENSYPASAFELRICRCEARAASSCLTVPRTQSLHGRICLGHLCIECTRNSAAPVAIRAMQLRFGAVSGSIAMAVFSRLRVRVRHVQRYIV